jgi:hypothetical protein
MGKKKVGEMLATKANSERQHGKKLSELSPSELFDWVESTRSRLEEKEKRVVRAFTNYWQSGRKFSGPDIKNLLADLERERIAAEDDRERHDACLNRLQDWKS